MEELLKLSSISVNLCAIQDFLWYGTVQSNATMYQNIYKVPHGHILKDDGTLTSKIDYTSIAIDNHISFESASAKFRQIFENATKNLIDTSKTIGCQLSGGFDSSSVYGIATKYTDNIIALSKDFSHPSCDERDYIDAVMKFHRYKTDIIRKDCTALDYKYRYNMKWNYDLNPHWPIWVTFTMLAPLMEAVRENNIDTVLTGQVGDHTLAGSQASIINHLYRGKISDFIREVSYLKHPKRYIQRHFKNKLKDKIGESNFNRLKMLLGKPVIQPSCEEVFGEKVPSRSFVDIVDSKTFKWVDQERIVDAVTSSSFHMSKYSSFSNAVYEKYGIKFVSPFEDEELIKFMLSVPPEYRYSMGNRRHLHAYAMKDILPPKVLNRRDKAEFSVIVRQQIDAIDREKLWQDPTLVKMGLIKLETIKAHEQAYISGKMKPQDFNRYWRMINIEYWYALNPYLDRSEFAPNPYVLESCK